MLVRTHVDCENRHDLNGIIATFGKAVAYEDQAWRELHPGSDGIRTYYEEFLGACDNLTIDVHQEHVCADTIVLEVTISGTHTGSVWPARHRPALRHSALRCLHLR